MNPLDRFNQNVYKTKDFSVERQWHQYLERVGLTEKMLPPDQLREMKRTFYGAAGQMLFLLRDGVAAYPERLGILFLKQMQDEIGNFWNSEAKRDN